MRTTSVVVDDDDEEAGEGEGARRLAVEVVEQQAGGAEEEEGQPVRMTFVCASEKQVGRRRRTPVRRSRLSCSWVRALSDHDDVALSMQARGWARALRQAAAACPSTSGPHVASQHQPASSVSWRLLRRQSSSLASHDSQEEAEVCVREAGHRTDWRPRQEAFASDTRS